MKKFTFYRQLDEMDCGPTCLKMIAAFYGKVYATEYLRELSHTTREGVSLMGLSEAAEAIAMKSFAVKVDFTTLLNDVTLPCIIHWQQNHFVVVYRIGKNKIWVADPSFNLITYSKEEFLAGWLYNKKKTATDEGIVFIVEPTVQFFEEETGTENRRTGIKILFPYLKPFTKYILQLFVGLIIASILQLIFPFLTQGVVDYGIKNQNIHFIYLMLFAQLMLFFSQSTVEIIRSWILLHVGSRMSISLLSDFLVKVMKLPIAFFDSKMTGDLLQRIEDHNRIESLLSSTTLNVLFSVVNLFVFGTILAFYNLSILLIFLLGAVLYSGWVLFFMKRRATLDFKRYSYESENRNSLIQLIQGMQEIKLNNSEKRRRWEWETTQVKLFKISLKGLTVAQYQTLGANFINQIKNIFITFLSAKAVIQGDMTLGMMLAVQYIIGQLNEPINNFISFTRTAQDASLSLQRLGEIHDKEEEEKNNLAQTPFLATYAKDIFINNVSFSYSGPNSPAILKDLDFYIPQGKVTAIVGASGSGKTTLLKLLLKFYAPTQGKIQVGNISLNTISARAWREKCGVVMQDGFIFADTIARNITESDSHTSIDRKRLLHAVRVANIENFIESLPQGYNTNIGGNGIALSGGEKQRLLIARAVYKNPEFLFFDEATSALDANNEKIIMKRLEDFYAGRTVVVIAHRLSTVKNADQVLMMDQGRIIESGSHDYLTQTKGAYYTLVKNQLELGN
ncbi:peptidase domain-containing ABC transporter [Adhaeribacter radiodurans]|uniref:Peptidase domain-containing ABC transporter n=1 Tax=Adhaeribacter radiodurans TaxID=2745197 RepID=A0A7L7L608_9BACT|nr:peptidase domain-containing ABC transporter [Adhaeribacter radiodurans]QMU28194.1 peptidase domain-containing ABC transporter [Adhaeribacter radiodurans]